MTTIINGDIEEGSKYISVVAKMKERYATSKSKVPWLKPLSGTDYVRITMLPHNKPFAIIFAQSTGNVYISVMNITNTTTSPYPTDTLPPYQPLISRDMYLSNITPTFKKGIYAGGKESSQTYSSTHTMSYSYGGSWHDVDFKMAISWTNSALSLETAVFINGNFGTIPFPSLLNSTEDSLDSSKGLYSSCYVVAMCMLSTTEIVALYSDDVTRTGSGCYHIIKFAVTKDSITGLLTFTQTNDLRLIVGLAGDFRPNTTWTGFTQDRKRLASWGGNDGNDFETLTGSIWADFRTATFNADFTAYTVGVFNYNVPNSTITCVKAEKATFTCGVYTVTTGTNVSESIVSFDTIFNTVYPNIVAFDASTNSVIFDYLSLDEDIFIVKVLNRSTNAIIVPAILSVSGGVSQSQIVFSDFGYTERASLYVQEYGFSINASSNKYFALISYSNYSGTNPSAGSYLINLKTKEITVLPNIDIYEGVRYPIGLIKL